jgi:hypothetical protein
MPVYPISFSIPESKIVSSVPEKTKRYGHIVPGDLSTYIFSDEASYAKDYQMSVFGKTKKKDGWDCMRHYEILANGCIPHFDRLDECPTNTMTHFPKEIVAKAMASETPEDYIPELLEYTRRHLTCRAMAQYVFDTVGCPTPKRVLFLSSDPKPDYLRCLTLIGMKQILGAKCVDSVVVPHIYDDYSNPETLYGKGFTYSCAIPSTSKPGLVHIDEVYNGSFDLVVYGSYHRGLPYWDDVSRAYPPERIVMLCGEDCDPNSEYHLCSATKYADMGNHVFIREQSSAQ